MVTLLNYFSQCAHISPLFSPRSRFPGLMINRKDRPQVTCQGCRSRGRDYSCTSNAATLVTARTLYVPYFSLYLLYSCRFSI